MATTRRDMIRKTVAGGAAAGVVFSAPRIEGLQLRPDYAAAMSQPCITGDIPTAVGDSAMSGEAFSGFAPADVVSVRILGTTAVAAADGTGIENCALTIDEFDGGTLVLGNLQNQTTGASQISATYNVSGTTDFAPVVTIQLCCP